MSSRGKRFAAMLIVALFFVGLCLAFPRVLAFVELAARELRYFWWLVLILALGIWLAFFVGRRER